MDGGHGEQAAKSSSQSTGWEFAACTLRLSIQGGRVHMLMQEALWIFLLDNSARLYEQCESAKAGGESAISNYI